KPEGARPRRDPACGGDLLLAEPAASGQDQRVGRIAVTSRGRRLLRRGARGDSSDVARVSPESDHSGSSRARTRLCRSARFARKGCARPLGRLPPAPRVDRILAGSSKLVTGSTALYAHASSRSHLAHRTTGPVKLRERSV